MIQYGTAILDAQNDAIETTVGTAPLLQLFNGSLPANCAAADAGTKIAEGALPSDWLGASSSGTKSKAGTWTLTGLAAAGAGTAAQYFRLKNSAGSTCHGQGTVGTTVPLTTNALTAANSAVLNFASTTGVVVGMNVSGTGVPAGARVVAVTGTTVTLNLVSTAGVANAAAITFSYDLALDNVSIANGQTVTINSASFINTANA